MTAGPEYAVWEVLFGLAGIVVLYYAGTRGIVVWTRRIKEGWARRALVSLSFATLFAPSVMGLGHGGVVPAPAWVVGIEYGTAGIWDGVVRWGVVPVLLMWGLFFAVSSVRFVLSKNNNKKVDTHEEDT